MGRTSTSAGWVYLGVRTLHAAAPEADEGHIINTSSVNGFWRRSAPAFRNRLCSRQVRGEGFSEALMTDLRLNGRTSNVRS